MFILERNDLCTTMFAKGQKVKSKIDLWQKWCQRSCGLCGEVTRTKVKGSWLDFDKACVTKLERLKIGGIILKSNVCERETSTYKR